MASLIVIFTQPPYGNQSVTDGLEFVLASTNYGHDTAVLFTGMSVYQLLKNQQVSDQKNHLKQLNVLPFYDVESIYVCQNSLEQLGYSVEELALCAEPLNAIQVQELLTNSDHTVTF